MKLTKRILSVLTAIVLCLAPMALMVGAAETLQEIEIRFITRGDVCGHNPDNIIITGGEYDPDADEYVYGTYYCKRIWYRDASAYCPVCDRTYTVDYGKLIPHPSFIQSQVNGFYYCCECNMIKQN